MGAGQTLRIVLATADSLQFQGEAASVVIPGADGELGVLPGHAPIAGMLGAGEVRIAGTAGALSFFAAGGFFRVLKDEVHILADEVAAADKVDAAGAEALLARARTLPAGTDAEHRASADAFRNARARLRFARRRP